MTPAEMLARQLGERGIDNPRVLEALARIPRHRFVPPDVVAEAYEDHALPIGGGQTISQPYIVARMTELLALRPRDRVLEIGTGSGYQTALLLQLAAAVFSVERYPELAQRAQTILRQLGYGPVAVRVGDGTMGWPEMAPFDAILVTACAPSIPEPLVHQLAPGGRLVVPVGNHDEQYLMRLVRPVSGPVWEERLDPVRFVPLVGRYGWDEDD
jgi:protein-L-isoaspartate(D-aspartate) O-methyltransferase